MLNQNIVNTQNQNFQAETEKLQIKDNHVSQQDENKNEVTFNFEITSNQLKNSFDKNIEQNFLSTKSDQLLQNNMIPFSKTKKEVQNFVNIFSSQTETDQSCKNQKEKQLIESNSQNEVCQKQNDQKMLKNKIKIINPQKIFYKSNGISNNFSSYQSSTDLRSSNYNDQRSNNMIIKESNVPTNTDMSIASFTVQLQQVFNIFREEIWNEFEKRDYLKNSLITLQLEQENQSNHLKKIQKELKDQLGPYIQIDNLSPIDERNQTNANFKLGINEKIDQIQSQLKPKVKFCQKINSIELQLQDLKVDLENQKKQRTSQNLDIQNQIEQQETPKHDNDFQSLKVRFDNKFNKNDQKIQNIEINNEAEFLKISLQIKELRKDTLNRATFDTLKKWEENIQNQIKEIHSNFEQKYQQESNNNNQKMKINISEMRRTIDQIKFQFKILFPQYEEQLDVQTIKQKRKTNASESKKKKEMRNRSLDSMENYLPKINNTPRLSLLDQIEQMRRNPIIIQDNNLQSLHLNTQRICNKETTRQEADIMSKNIENSKIKKRSSLSKSIQKTNEKKVDQIEELNIRKLNKQFEIIPNFNKQKVLIPPKQQSNLNENLAAPQLKKIDLLDSFQTSQEQSFEPIQISKYNKSQKFFQVQRRKSLSLKKSQNDFNKKHLNLDPIIYQGTKIEKQELMKNNNTARTHKSVQLNEEQRNQNIVKEKNEFKQTNSERQTIYKFFNKKQRNDKKLNNNTYFNSQIKQ